MHRLSLLLLALALASLGVRLVSAAETFAPFLLRDGLLLGLAGAALFAAGASGWRTPAPPQHRRGLAPLGRLLLATGGIVALVGGAVAGLNLAGVPGLAAWLTWLLGLALILAGAWWPGGQEVYAPPALRWTKDVTGNFVPVATEGGPPPDERKAPLSRRATALWLVVLLAVAALLRFWNLGELPPGCVGSECADALHLLDGEPLAAGTGLYARLAQLALAITGSGVLSLRLAAALCGWLGVLAMFGAARRLATPLNALLATALLALSPWHLWAGRSSDPWLAVALLVTITLWLLLEATVRASLRWWLPAGIAAGLLLVEAPPLRLATALWFGAAVVVALVAGWRRTPERWARMAPLAGLVAGLATALPTLLATVTGGAPLFPSTALPGLANTVTLLGTLLRPDVVVTGPFAGAGLLVGVAAVLGLAGAGVLVRHLRQPGAAIPLLGALLIFAAAAAGDLLQPAPASLLLAWLPFVVALAAVALDVLLGVLLATWGPPLFRPARLAAAAALVLLLLAGRQTVAFMAELDAVRTGSGSQVETDMARYIATWGLEHPGQATTFVVPAGVLDHPSLRLLAGSALAEGRVRPLEIARTLPLAETVPGDLLYLVPMLDGQVLTLLRELYPSGVAATQLDPAGERSLFNTYQVTQPALDEAQGLLMLAAPSQAAGAASVPVQSVDALTFAWSAAPPVAGPFEVQWFGSLVAPAAGSYTFAVESSAPDSRFVLQLDDLLILDTTLALTEQSLNLAQGVYRVGMRYRSGGKPGDLHVRWAPPGTELQVIQGAALHTPVLADQGLLGDYYAGGQFAGEQIAERKDAIVGMDTGLPLPYSVRWQGQLAAPRAGEYLIGVAGDGFAQVTVDGLRVVEHVPLGDAARDEAYTEGLIYLAAGWHPVEVRHAPEQNAQLRLLWQPAGSLPGELGGQYLLPRIGAVTPADRPLPPAPALAAPQLGDDSFALSQASPVWQPGVRLPPTNLPPLPLEALWVAGDGCGAGEGQLNAPHGLAFSRDGSQLHVADTGNRRIVTFDLDGGVRGVAGSELYQEPVDVDVTPGGALLVLDAVAQQVFQVDAAGVPAPLALKTSFYRPRGMSVDPAGNLAVADTGGGRVAFLTPDGTLAAEFGGQGSLLSRGQPVDALGTAAAIWAITAEDGRLWNLSLDGSLTAAQPGNTIDGPHLALLPDGRILATDPARATFLLYSARGEPAGQFGYAGQFAVPTGIAATQVGDRPVIAVSDTRQCTVSLWRLVE